MHVSLRALKATLIGVAIALAIGASGLSCEFGVITADTQVAYAESFEVGQLAEKTYKIVYKLNGGKQAKNQIKKITRGKTLKASKLRKPTRTGYKFAGWYADKKLKKKATKLKGVTAVSKRRVYAKWKPQSYSIRYKTNGGALSEGYAKSFKGINGLSKLPTPSRPGYSFLGWCSDAELTHYVDEIPKRQFGNVVLFAKWRKRVIVAHRGYYAGGQVQNSLGAYRAAADKGFSYVETDVRFTADGKPVLNHDAVVSVYKKDEDGNAYGSAFSLEIDSVTLDELQNHYVAAHPSGETVVVDKSDSTNNGQKGDLGHSKTYTKNLAEFSEFLDICEERGLIPYIELKEGTKKQVKSLVSQVDARGMTYAVRWISFQSDLLGYVKSVHPESNFTYLTKSISSSVIKKAKKLASSGGDAIVGLKASNVSKTGTALCKSNHMPLSIWAVRDENAISGYDQYICDFTVNKIAGIRAPENV